MRKLNGKSLVFRSAASLLILAMGALLLEGLLQVDEAIIAWTGRVVLAIMGGWLCAMPLAFSRQYLVNRWHRATYWAFWVVCALAGVLIIGAVVIWAINRSTNGSLAGAILTIIVPVIGMLGFLVVGGLVVAGKIAQGNEETREWARSWARTHGAAEARLPQENTPAE